MNFKLMAVFAKVIEKGIMAQAARELNMTPAAVSKHILELEEHLGVRLIQRTTRRLEVTEAGMSYYESCVEILQKMEEIHQNFVKESAKVKGRLRIVAPMSFGLTKLAIPISTFKSLYPDVEIRLHLDDAPTHLIENRFDLAIRIQREMKDSSMIAKSFAEYRHYIVCAQSYYKKFGPIKEPEDLKTHPCLAYSNASRPYRWSMKHKSHRYVHIFSPHFEANNSIILKELILRGQGIGLLPGFLIEEELIKNKVVHLLPHCELEPAKAWLVYPSKKFNPLIVTRFIDFFMEHIAKESSS